MTEKRLLRIFKHDCDKHMQDKNAALWRVKKISYCEILDDLLNGFIDNKKYEYFKEPESVDGEWKTQCSLEEIETDVATRLKRERNKLQDILFETWGELFKYWTLIEALRKTTISGNVDSVIYGRGNFDTVDDLYEEKESRKSYQRVLENKIRRLKDRIKVLEGNYGKGDKERLQAEGKVRKDNFDRRVKW